MNSQASIIDKCEAFSARYFPVRLGTASQEAWIKWLPWLGLWLSLGALLAVVAMRFAMVFASAMTMQANAMQPSGVGPQVAMETPLLWTLAFYLNIAQVVVGPIAFPMLRARAALGWTIAFGVAVAWSAYGLLSLITGFRNGILFSVVELLLGIFVLGVLLQLRKHYVVSRVSSAE